MFPLIKGGWKQVNKYKKRTEKGTKKFGGVTDMFINFIVVMTFQVYTCIKTYQIIQLNKCDLLYVNYSSISNFLIRKKNKYIFLKKPLKINPPFI